MKTKQIVILIAVIFLAFVAYKIIATNVQQNKEEAVTQQKYQLDQLQKSQEAASQQQTAGKLDSCISDAQDNAYLAEKNLDIENGGSGCYSGGKDPQTLVQCLSAVECKNGNIDTQIACEQGIVTVQNQIKTQLQQDKDNCYKQYK